MTTTSFMGLIFCLESLLDIDFHSGRVMHGHAHHAFSIEAATLLIRLLRRVHGKPMPIATSHNHRRDCSITRQLRPARRSTEDQLSCSGHVQLALSCLA